MNYNFHVRHSFNKAIYYVILTPSAKTAAMNIKIYEFP